MQTTSWRVYMCAFFSLPASLPPPPPPPLALSLVLTPLPHHHLTLSRTKFGGRPPRCRLLVEPARVLAEVLAELPKVVPETE